MTAKSTNPLTGTWKLNVGKSSFSPGPAPLSQTIKFESTEDSLKVTTTIFNADGSRTETYYTAKYDGADYPVTGLDNVETVAMKRIDELTDLRTDKKGGQVTGTRIRTVAQDRMSYAVTGEGVNSKGAQFRHLLRYEKLA